MDVCKHCKKELSHTEGRRKKEFCNPTCRSNFWYEQNVKNKPKKVVIKKEEPETEKSNVPNPSDKGAYLKWLRTQK